MTHFEWPVGSPTRGQICWRKSDNMLSDLKIVERIVKSRSDNMLSDFHGNPTVCCRIWGAHSKWVGAREGRPPSQGASPLSSLKPLTKSHETQFYSKWVNSKWVRVSPIWKAKRKFSEGTWNLSKVSENLPEASSKVRWSKTWGLCNIQLSANFH